MNISILTVLVLSLLFSPNDLVAKESHPGLAIEVMYTEALLAFNKHHPLEAAKLLDEVLLRDASYLPALEMRALTLKVNGDDQESIKIYSKLIELKPSAESGPYHFELGSIFNRKKDYEKAKFHLSKCLELKFNQIPAHLLLGTIAFTSGNYGLAEENFSFLKEGQVPAELKLMAHYYLGLVNFKMGYGSIGTSEILDARSLAVSLPESKSASDIKKSADQILAPFEKSRWFANFTLVGQYDSNIGQIPIGISNPLQLSGKSTPELSLSATAGGMSSPLDLVQFVGTYQGSTNLNLNSNTKNYQYVTNSASLFANYRALSALSGGVKVVGSFIFQNEQMKSGSSNSYAYGKSGANAEMGPFLKLLFNKTMQLQTNVYVRPQVSYLYPEQTGTAFGAHLNLSSNTMKFFFNPAFNLSVEKVNTASTDYTYLAYGSGISNMMKLSTVDTVTLSLDVLYTNYLVSSTKRADVNLPIRLSWTHLFSNQWTLVGDFSYVDNISNIASSYSYDRFTSGLGVALSL